MPIFDYKCEKCGKVKEKIVSFSDVETQKSFECECDANSKMVRVEVPTSTNFHLKGRGWYKTGGY